MSGFVNVRIPLAVRRVVTMVPALIVLAIGVSPTSALVLSQVVLSFGIPFALVPLVMLTSRRDVMGVHVNRRLTTLLAFGVAGLIMALNVFLIAQQVCSGPATSDPGRLPTRSTRSSTRCPTTGPTSSSICGSSTSAATSTPRSLLVTCNAQPYSKYDWHWRMLVAHRFGHAAAAQACTALKLLDEAGIDGELAVREVRDRTRRGPPELMWGRPQSVRDEFKRIRAQ